MANRPGRRVAIVAGLRTPFVKAGGVFKSLTALDLGVAVVKELVQRSEVPVDLIDALVFGTVIPNVLISNIAREVALAAGLPKKLQAFSVVRACATSMQALTTASNAIALGDYDVAVVGGTESMSDIPISLSKPLAKAFVDASKGRSALDKLKAFGGVHAQDLLPVPPAIAEYSTGETMGAAAEKMAKENGISREAQDAFAHRSHSKAAAAWADGSFRAEVMSLQIAPKYEASVGEDNLIRKDSTLEGYATLKPAFDRKYGSITAGNASPLTDGAAALVIMSEEKARDLGLKPLGFLRASAYAAVDPKWQLLQAPAFSVPMVLKRAGMQLSDIDLVEVHEAFAAQVLSNLQAWDSKKFADEYLAGATPIGQVPDEKLNPRGGSIALGHPFGATGARMVTQSLLELAAMGKNTALLSICAAGGMGGALVLERE